MTTVAPWGAWGISPPEAHERRRFLPALAALFPEQLQPRLFDPGPVPWVVPKMAGGRQVTEAGEPLYELDPRIVDAFNERWRGRKVRTFSESGVTEGYCGGVGPGFLGPAVSVSEKPGVSRHIDPRGLLAITEIEHFAGEETFEPEEAS